MLNNPSPVPKSSKANYLNLALSNLTPPRNIPIILCCACEAPNSILNVKLLCTKIFEVKNKFKKAIFWLAGDFPP